MLLIKKIGSKFQITLDKDIRKQISCSHVLLVFADADGKEFTEKAKITERGQIVIIDNIRNCMELKEGDVVAIEFNVESATLSLHKIIKLSQYGSELENKEYAWINTNNLVKKMGLA